MQPNEIIIQVDPLNDTTIVPETFSRFEEYLNRSKYVTENHSLNARDELTLYRTFPKQAGNFRGVGKSAAKFAYDIIVPGVDSTTSLSSSIIVEVSFSIPVGADPADVLWMRQRSLALLDLDTVMSPLNERLMV